jgi:hypothetical protein
MSDAKLAATVPTSHQSVLVEIIGLPTALNDLGKKHTMLTLHQRTDCPNLQYQAFKCSIWEVSSWWLITKCLATARPLDELECDHGFFV